jgi:hypothetical protein
MALGGYIFLYTERLSCRELRGWTRLHMQRETFGVSLPCPALEQLMVYKLRLRQRTDADIGSEPTSQLRT